MILEESGPGLRAGFGGVDLGDIGLDGMLGDSDTEFEELAANAFGTPELILLCHLPDQGDGFRG